MAEPCLAARGVDKRFGGVHALRGVDFDLGRDEVHALVGENGAGKSTLIKILSGLVAPDAGAIRLDGQPARIDSVKAAQALGIQTIHQELELALPLSVAENVFMGRLPVRRGRVDFAALHRQTAEALAKIGAPIDPRTRVRDLSVSDRQVVEIARTVVREARIVIMDEPTAALPPREVERLFQVIRALKAAGVAIVYVSHKLDEVLAIADRVTVLRDGANVASLARSEASRPALVRHILGRELMEFHVEKQAPRAGAAIACRSLAAAPELADLSFDSYRGEVLGFYGLLGAGQSAIGDVLVGVRPGSAESIRINEISGLPSDPHDAVRRGIGYVPADRKVAGLALLLSVKENLLLTDLASIARHGLIDERRARTRAESLVQRFHIRCGSIEQKARQLSGGNQQKVALAKWIGRKVEILVLDEPTRGVDVGAKVEIYRVLRELAEAGSACLIASSDAGEIAAVCDRAIVMKAGRPAAELSGNALTADALTNAAI
jgi:ABC-type sugar transport system ATPase subunit